MNKQYTKIVLAVIAATAGLAMNANAAFTFDTQGTELLLNFRKTGDGSDINVKLGSMDFIKSSGSVNPFVASDVTSTYGSLNDLKWSVIGYKAFGASTDASVPEGTLYITRNTTTAWNSVDSYTTDSIGVSYGSVGGYAESAGLDFRDTATKTSSANANSYNKLIGANANFGDSVSFPGGVEATTPSSGTWAQNLYLYQMTPNNSSYSGKSVQEIGIITLSSGGALTFAPVPEPSDYATVAGGALMLFTAIQSYRRRQTSAA
jgi:hypothetical protein